MMVAVGRKLPAYFARPLRDQTPSDVNVQVRSSVRLRLRDRRKIRVTLPMASHVLRMATPAKPGTATPLITALANRARPIALVRISPSPAHFRVF